MTKYFILFILTFYLSSCEKDNELTTPNLLLKGQILGKTVSLSEENSSITIVNSRFLSNNIFISAFHDGDISYQLLITIPEDSISNSDLFSILQTGQYGFEEYGFYDFKSPFRFNIVEGTSENFKAYTTYSNSNSAKIEVRNIELESDSTMIISVMFNSDLYVLEKNQIVGRAENVELKTRFLLK